VGCGSGDLAIGAVVGIGDMKFDSFRRFINEF
jgi:hypothetical protein